MDNSRVRLITAILSWFAFACISTSTLLLNNRVTVLEESVLRLESRGEVLFRDTTPRYTTAYGLYSHLAITPSRLEIGDAIKTISQEPKQEKDKSDKDQKDDNHITLPPDFWKKMEEDGTIGPSVTLQPFEHYILLQITKPENGYKMPEITIFDFPPDLKEVHFKLMGQDLVVTQKELAKFIKGISTPHLICQQCKQQGRKSKVLMDLSKFLFIDGLNYPLSQSYYDEDGNWVDPDYPSAPLAYKCSNGHSFTVGDDGKQTPIIKK